ISDFRTGVTSGNAETHAGLLKFRRIFIKRVVSVIFAARKRKDAGQDYGNVLLLQETRDFPRIVPAQDYRLELQLLGETNRPANLGFTIGAEDHRLLASDVRHERLEHDVPIRTRQRLVFRVSILRTAVSLRVTQHLSNLLDLPLVCGQRFREIGRLLEAATETTTGEGDARVVDHERGLGNNSHFFRSRAEQVDQRRLTGDQAAGRSGKCVGYAFDARDADVCAVWVDGDDGFGVRVQIADFGKIHSAVRALRDFDEAHVCAGVDHTGID